MIFKNIFVIHLIYIISLLLISAFFIKNSSLAEDVKESVDPVIIWDEEEEIESFESSNKIDISINDEQKSNIKCNLFIKRSFNLSIYIYTTKYNNLNILWC